MFVDAEERSVRTSRSSWLIRAVLTVAVIVVYKLHRKTLTPVGTLELEIMFLMIKSVFLPRIINLLFHRFIFFYCLHTFFIHSSKDGCFTTDDAFTKLKSNLKRSVKMRNWTNIISASSNLRALVKISLFRISASRQTRHRNEGQDSNTNQQHPVRLSSEVLSITIIRVI